ncbi:MULTISPECIES: amphi-Trp domain-containing protein [unclassified Pseudodesulfovibrio]|uniref:amphi-Trp domain-containing protein n=1 Tax=unclassified Pseudodesulfovibrio TaxID=2661612 RepID=UPI000FEBC660|nr:MULTISPECIES: amphi-Trp domain-containing protein [unclassified Pseudodesulfovibrio]MCJ2164393.1 amphi-Trp domain-containing protein [Pseudodesulfovibrio sp. S3-i]RWU04600.1 amphi-Trp domain-containing protein [Pseudodesulfovibrio sp. S3]
MSDDKRLGTNPLNWVAPNTALPRDERTPDTASDNRPTAGAFNGMSSGFFQPAGTITKEDQMGKGKIKIKQTMDTAQVVAYLKDLTRSLESGVIRAENEEGTLVLGVADTMEVELKLARKKDKAKCAIEMEWTDDGSKAEGLIIKNSD